jgi:hypothetical protein
VPIYGGDRRAHVRLVCIGECVIELPDTQIQ